MLSENLKAGWKSIRKHRYHSILNVLGFAVALSVVILIGLFVQRELSTNMFHKDADRIYKIGGWGCPYALAPTIAEGIPEIEAITNLMVARYSMMLKTEDEKEVLAADGVAQVDLSFFDVFTFPLVMGDPDNPFPDYQSIVVTRSMAQAMFGDENPIGKRVDVYGSSFTISGMTEDVPLNSSLRYSVVMPLNPSKLITFGRTFAQDWSSFAFEVYAKVAPGQDRKQLEEKIQNLIKQKGNLQYDVEILKLYTLKEVYFNFFDVFTGLKGGNYGQVRAVLWVGILILLLAIVNFFNLSTASAMKRSKEIGLRKVNGATRTSLMGQFILESILITFISMLLALILVNVAVPFFSGLVGAHYDFILMNKAWHWLLLIGGSVAVGIVAGSYPAFYLSGTDPINALYSGRVQGAFGVMTFRRILIVFQLVASIALIICTFVISGQLNLLRTKDLGFDKDAILCIRMDNTIYKQKQAFLSEVAAVPFVENFTITQKILGNWDNGAKVFGDYHGDQRELWSKVMHIDTAFVSTFGIELAEGRVPLSHEKGCVLINETAAKAFDADSPLELLVDHYGERTGDREPTQFYKVLGVVKDFNFKTLGHGIEPLVMYLQDIPAGLINLRLNARSMDDFETVKKEIEKVYEKFDPEDPLSSFFLDSYLAELYESEQQFKVLFTFFSTFAVLISCFGLFGLIIFSNARRRKEIGVRRVQGATVPQIIFLLIRDYLIYVGIAFAVAVPLAWYVMVQWLSDYPYRIGLRWWYFLLAGVIATCIVALTVGLQSWRAATANPVESLKTE